MDALSNLGTIHFARGDLTEAAECYEQALRLAPENGKVLCNRAYLRLLQGDFERGWRDYEARWSQPGVTMPSLSRPRWEGAPLAGKTIFVYAEQSLGDSIQFARYLPLVKRQGGFVLFGCQPPLVGLMSRLPAVDRIVTAGEPLPAFDMQVPLLSLPGLFRTTLASIPSTVPYLSADPALVRRWHAEITGHASGPDAVNVGIVWQGRHEHRGDRQRSLPLPLFEGLASIPGVRLWSLQVGVAAAQVATAHFSIIDLGSQFNPLSLEDVAAAMLNLDLVVTVDTGVAHLAGALGVPVWTLLPFMPDWRWLLDRTDSPWYPSMRLFRQRQPGAWPDVLAEVAGGNWRDAPGPIRGAGGDRMNGADMFQQAVGFHQQGDLSARKHFTGSCCTPSQITWMCSATWASCISPGDNSPTRPLATSKH